MVKKEFKQSKILAYKSLAFVYYFAKFWTQKLKFSFEISMQNLPKVF